PHHPGHVLITKMIYTEIGNGFMGRTHTAITMKETGRLELENSKTSTNLKTLLRQRIGKHK
ncbi:hypothetical protein ACQP3D_29770, partial [Escherichia coli]